MILDIEIYMEHKKIRNAMDRTVGVEKRHVCEIHPPVWSRTLISFAVSLGQLLREIRGWNGAFRADAWMTSWQFIRRKPLDLVRTIPGGYILVCQAW